MTEALFPRGLKRSMVFAFATLFLVVPRPSHSQVLTDKELEEASGLTFSSMSNDAGPVGIIPYLHGFNASLGTTSQHDSSSGWSSVVSPNVAYRFNRNFSADIGLPVYTYIKTYENVGTKAKPVYAYKPKRGVIGDTFLSLHADAMPYNFGYDASISLGMPTGNTAYGLGAGQVTFNLNNHIERTFGIFSPNIELGYGDTSTLVDARIRKDYISVGPLAHFQSGVGVDLPRGMWFEADVYEQLPLSKDLIYSTTTKGKKKITTVKNVGIAEDNGFLTSLDVPITPHVTLSGFYNRSLRDHSDVAGFSFTFLLKHSPRPSSLIE